MAARLMCHTNASRGILVDQKTYNLCQDEFEFENLGETKVKGKADPISIFKPVFAISEVQKETKKVNVFNYDAAIGRVFEKQAILEVLNQLKSSPSVDILLFSAEDGLGLSTIVNYAKTEGLNQKCSIWYFKDMINYYIGSSGKAGQLEQHNFSVWRTIIQDLVQLLIIGIKNKQ